MLSTHDFGFEWVLNRKTLMFDYIWRAAIRPWTRPSYVPQILAKPVFLPIVWFLGCFCTDFEDDGGPVYLYHIEITDLVWEIHLCPLGLASLSSYSHLP